MTIIDPVLHLHVVQPADGKSEDPAQENCEEVTCEVAVNCEEEEEEEVAAEVAVNLPPQCDEANCESTAGSCVTAAVVATADITTDTTEDITRDATVDITRDATVDITADATEDITRDATVDITADAMADITTDATDDITADATEDITADATSACSSTAACNGGSIDSGLGTGCRSSFASGDRLPLKAPTSSDKLSSLSCGAAGPVCSPVDEQQSPMSSTSSFLLPTPTTEEMCDEWSLVSDNKSEGGETATGIIQFRQC